MLFINFRYRIRKDGFLKTFYILNIYSANNLIILIFEIDTVSDLKFCLYKLMNQLDVFLTDLLTFMYLVPESKDMFSECS